MENSIVEIEISEINVIEELYPRDEISSSHVKLYRQNLEELPPILLAKVDNKFVLIDGAHRLTAHELEKKKTIKAIIKNIPKDRILVEAIESNARHGKQLTMKEKKRLLPLIYLEYHRLGKKEGLVSRLAKVFAVGETIVKGETNEARGVLQKERERLMLKLHLQCKTQKEIAGKVGYTQQAVSDFLGNTKTVIKDENCIPKSLQVSDVWRFSSKDRRFGTEGYPGSIPGQVVENFLYYFTNIFDIVVDPMAGGGTTIGVCKSMYRRYRAYDINPLKALDIKKNDITKGYPPECKSCDAIYLDPPYWHSMAYYDNTVDKLSRKDFLNFIGKLAEDSFETVKHGGIVGFICEDMVKGYPNLYKGDPNDKMLSMIHLAPLFEKAGFELEWRIHVPLTLAQYTAMKTAYAKNEKIMLHLVRDFLIWRKS